MPLLSSCNKEIEEVGSDVRKALQKSVFSKPNGENTVCQERGSDQVCPKLCVKR